VLIKKVRELSVPAQIEYLATSAPDMAGGMLAAMLELIRAHLPVRPQGLDSQTAEGMGEPAGTLELCCMDVEERFPQLAHAITDQHLALLNPQQVTHGFSGCEWQPGACSSNARLPRLIVTTTAFIAYLEADE
jgi:hypothetical protein